MKMLFILLADSPGPNGWINIGIGIVVAVFGFLYGSLQKEQKKRVDKIEEDNEKDHENFDKYIKELEKGQKAMSEKINDVNIKILTEINLISIKIAEFKRDIIK